MEMKQLNTADLTGKALDWAVAEIEFNKLIADGQHIKDWVLEQHKAGERTSPFSSEWVFAGPIIERERIATDGDDGPWNASLPGMPSYYSADTLLVAAMRAYVGFNMGDTAQVPENLVRDAAVV